MNWRMSAKDKRDLKNLVIHLKVASGIRTFPNGRKIEFRRAKAMNIIGKDIEFLVLELRLIMGEITKKEFRKMANDPTLATRLKPTFRFENEE